MNRWAVNTASVSRTYHLKLTSVARASLEELKLDYQDFLRQRGLTEWRRDDPRRASLIDRRPKTADDVAMWARELKNSGLSGRGGQSGQSIKSTESTTSTVASYPEIAANGALALIAVACSLLDRQIASLEKAFVDEGGFTERLYRVRTAARGNRNKK